MNKLPIQIAKEQAIKAIQEYKIVAELWGGENTKERKINFSFAYPRCEEKINEIEIGLEDVRASDGIKINYDFERDGYVIMQPYTIEVDRKEYVDCEEHWEEVGFFQSWALEHKNKKLSLTN